MIVLDASLLIAHLSSKDRHHERATRLLEDATDEELVVHELTLAEVLVAGVRCGRGVAMRVDLESIGVRVAEGSEDDALRLATLRAGTGLRLRDCCVLAVATWTAAPLASFDDRLRAAARRLGVGVLPP